MNDHPVRAAATATTQDHLRSFVSNLRVPGARIRVDLTEPPFLGSSTYDRKTATAIANAVEETLAPHPIEAQGSEPTLREALEQVVNLRPGCESLQDARHIAHNALSPDNPMGAGWSVPPKHEAPHLERLSAEELRLTGSALSEWSWDHLSRGYGVSLTVREVSRIIAAVQAQAALTRPDPSLGEPDEMTEDAIRSRAKALVFEKGWKPGDRLHLRGVIELMTDLGVQLSERPETARCGYPDCGCDIDATCNAALSPPSLGMEGVREALQPFADACPANDRLPDHDFVRLTHDGLLLTALRVADFRRAYQAIASISTPGKGEGE